MQESILTQLSQIGKPITITVKVAELFKSDYPPPNDDAIRNYTRLENGNGGDFGEPKPPFTTNIHKNDIVLWKIRFEDNTQRRDYRLDLVCITQKSENNVDFFDFHPLLPTNNLILATVTHGEPEDVYHYNIIFSISDNFGISRTYVIDPQLKMT